MYLERLTIYDSKKSEIGTATREEVHAKGYWHQTFQCWFWNNDDIYFQIRSQSKKDYPGLLDITAAGHILSTESVEDGVREIKEELGISLSLSDLTSIGLVEDCGEKENFIDNEFANVFLYNFELEKHHLHFLDKEVSGLVKANITSFYQLWSGEVTEIQITGFEIDSEGKQNSFTKNVSKNDFVPHPLSYITYIIDKINEQKPSNY